MGHMVVWGFSGDAVVKESTFSAGDSRDSFPGQNIFSLSLILYAYEMMDVH